MGRIAAEIKCSRSMRMAIFSGLSTGGRIRGRFAISTELRRALLPEWVLTKAATRIRPSGRFMDITSVIHPAPDCRLSTAHPTRGKLRARSGPLRRVTVTFGSVSTRLKSKTTGRSWRPFQLPPQAKQSYIATACLWSTIMERTIATGRATLGSTFGPYKWRWQLPGGGGSAMTEVNATIDGMTLTEER